MGSLCTNDNEYKDAELIRSATFEVDKQNDLLDNLAHERYRAVCKLQSNFRGFKIRKTLSPIFLLIKSRKKENVDQEI